MLDKIQYYFDDALWNFPINREKGVRYFLFKWLRIIYLSGKKFVSDRCWRTASSLTYYSLMSIVPIAAILLAIARVFGYHEALRHALLNRFDQQAATLDQVFNFADGLIEKTAGGAIAGISLVVFLLAGVFLLNSLESVLNDIWRIKTFRTWQKIVSDYFTLIILFPVLFVSASGSSLFIVKHLQEIVLLMPLSSWVVSCLLFLVHLIPYGLFCIFFTFIYLFIPSTKVYFFSALLAGFITSCLYVLIQWIYLYFQIGINSLGLIYGSLAALPLFLIWLQTSWLLLLLGAEISYAYQTFETFEFENRVENISPHFKLLTSLWITHLVLKMGYVSRETVVKKYQVPTLLAEMIFEDLVSVSILNETRGGYVPSEQAHTLKIAELIEILHFKGESDFPFIDSKALRPFAEALEQFQALIKSSTYNTQLTHVPDSI